MITIRRTHVKYSVIYILDDVRDANIRNMQIESIDNGIPYRYMLEHIYPKLRRVVVKVEYEVNTLDIQVARRMIIYNPEDLSLNEMYRVANSYEKGSMQFKNAFRIAAIVYPDAEIANINTITTLLLKGDVVTAEQYLGNVEINNYKAEYYNLLGVLEMLKGNDSKAERYLQIAINKGFGLAEKNLRKLRMK